jgi:transcriptional regulator with XRE-family HTH domain
MMLKYAIIQFMNEHNQQEASTLEEFLVRMMNERHLSITALARASGITPQTIHAYLNGARPSLEVCRKMSFFLGVSLGKIISLAYQDVEGKRLDSLIEVYLELPEEEKLLLEDFVVLLSKKAKKREQK